MVSNCSVEILPNLFLNLDLVIELIWCVSTSDGALSPLSSVAVSTRLLLRCLMVVVNGQPTTILIESLSKSPLMTTKGRFPACSLP